MCWLSRTRSSYGAVADHAPPMPDTKLNAQAFTVIQWFSLKLKGNNSLMKREYEIDLFIIESGTKFDDMHVKKGVSYCATYALISGHRA